MVHQKFVKESLFREMQSTAYLRYVCLPLADGPIGAGDLIVFQEVDLGRTPTGRMTVATIITAAMAESEHGPRVVMELALTHMRGGGDT